MSSLIDDRRKLSVFPNVDDAIQYLVKNFCEEAKAALKHHSWFSVALSGGSTPQKFYQKLTESHDVQMLDWEKICLFWSDERAVPPSHPDSNFRMAYEIFNKAPFNKAKIFRMQAEHEDKNVAAKEYEALIQKYCYDSCFDTVYLGLGEDGHTASLFPNTDALHETKKLVVSNYVPEKHSFRMTLTFPCINSARNIIFLCFGKGKAEVLKKVLFTNHTETLPASRVGTESSPAHFIVDKECMS